MVWVGPGAWSLRSHEYICMSFPYQACVSARARHRWWEDCICRLEIVCKWGSMWIDGWRCIQISSAPCLLHHHHTHSPPPPHPTPVDRGLCAQAGGPDWSLWLTPRPSRLVAATLRDMDQWRSVLHRAAWGSLGSWCAHDPNQWQHW